MSSLLQLAETVSYEDCKLAVSRPRDGLVSAPAALQLEAFLATLSFRCECCASKPRSSRLLSRCRVTSLTLIAFFFKRYIFWMPSLLKVYLLKVWSSLRVCSSHGVVSLVFLTPCLHKLHGVVLTFLDVGDILISNLCTCSCD